MLRPYLLAILILIALPGRNSAQSTGDYRSSQTGNWATAATWQYYDGTGWVAATAAPNSGSNVVTVRNGHTVTIAASVTVDQVVVESNAGLVVGSGATFTIANGAGVDMDGATGSTLLNQGGNIRVNDMTTVEFGALTQTAGTLTLPNGNNSTTNVIVHGDCAISGGTMSVSGSTNQVAEVLVEGDMTVSSILDVAHGNNASASLTVEGDLSILGTGITRLAQLSNSGTGVIAVGGDLSHYGTLTNPNYDVSLIMNGTANQTIATAAGDKPLTLVIANTGGGVTLSTPLTITGMLTLSSGIVYTTTANLLTMFPSALMSQFLTGTFDDTKHIDGPLAFDIASTSAQTRLFPVGKNGQYRPLSLATTQGSTSRTRYTAEVLNVPPTTRTLPPTLTKVSEVRHWSLAKSAVSGVIGSPAATGSAFVTLGYAQTGTDDGVTEPTTLRVAMDGGAGTWVDLGGTGSAAGTGAITSTTSFTTFSDFTLANANGGSNPLPVELTSFSAQRIDGRVELRWATATELNNRGFEIERSTDRSTWLKIGFVDGQGSSNAPTRYAFTDEQPVSGMSYYRLRQMDRDGTADYSPIVEVSAGITPATTELYAPYPNPATGNSTVSFYLPVEQHVALAVYDLGGREVARVIEGASLSAGTHAYPVALGGLATGSYIMRLTAGGLVLSRTVTLSR